MSRRNGMALTGCRCQCTSCQEYFASPGAFDRHRKGLFASPDSPQHSRHCLTAAEMLAAGWARNPRGFLMAPDARRAGAGSAATQAANRPQHATQSGYALLGQLQQLYGTPKCE
jgi:hypothetical protein